jgi:hypothetical protein
VSALIAQFPGTRQDTRNVQQEKDKSDRVSALTPEMFNRNMTVDRLSALIVSRYWTGYTLFTHGEADRMAAFIAHYRTGTHCIV